MQIYRHSFDCENMISPSNELWNFYPYHSFELSQLCFFDIETTGLAAATSNIYLIGAGYYTDTTFEVIQWFADDYQSEKEILLSFFDFVKDYAVLFHYNGTTFDLPYIHNKCKRHAIHTDSLNHLKSIDLYLHLRKYSSMLGLPNKKLKSFEQYVGRYRDDTFNGGELIQVYVEYMQNKYCQKENEKLLKLLLLHNYEDITGLSEVASLLFLKELDQLPITLSNTPSLPTRYNDHLTVYFNCQLPGDYSFELHSGVTCSWSKNQIKLEIPIIYTTLCYFFDDYKDYYYMIQEDTIMHKSVAIYTDASIRRKAKKSECFVEQQGYYIPVNRPGCFSQTMRIYRSDYTSKNHYIAYDPSNEYSQDFLLHYYSQILPK